MPAQRSGKTSGPRRNTFERLRGHLRRQRGSRPCRVLLIFGNPLGNPVGDTVMAVQHVDWLRHLADDVRISVWSGNGGVWHALAPGVETIELATADTFDTADVIVIDGPRVPAGLERAAARGSRIVLSWWTQHRAAHVRIGRKAFEVPLPRPTSLPGRIGEVYRALGFPRIADSVSRPAARRSGSTIRPLVLFNPYASSGRKSLPPRFASRLLRALLPRLADQARVVVPRTPVATAHDDVAPYRELGAVVRAARGMEIRPVTVEEYCRLASGADLVIGADTSSQHLAAFGGRPSIACYPADTLPGFYLAHGAIHDEAFHFTLPGARDSVGARQLVLLLADLAWRLLFVTSTSGEPADAGLLRTVAEVRRGLRDAVNGESGAVARLRRELAVLERTLPPAWARPIVGELDVLLRGLPALGRRGSLVRRAVLTQVGRLNALKLLTVLARTGGVRAGRSRRAISARRAGSRS